MNAGAHKMGRDLGERSGTPHSPGTGQKGEASKKQIDRRFCSGILVDTFITMRVFPAVSTFAAGHFFEVSFFFIIFYQTQVTHKYENVIIFDSNLLLF